jgi:hypothetical protein
MKKYQFTWCGKCSGVELCYKETAIGNGPNFLDKDCYKGPMIDNAKKEKNNGNA